jgi:hypothetical protein
MRRDVSRGNCFGDSTEVMGDVGLYSDWVGS